MNDILGNVEKCKPVPFQVHPHWFLADTCWDLFPSPCLVRLRPPPPPPPRRLPAPLPASTEGCSACCCSQPRLPTATLLLWVYTPQPTHRSTYFTGAWENSGSYLFNLLPLLPPLISSTITLAANKFTRTHLKPIQGGSSSCCHMKNTSCALL